MGLTKPEVMRLVKRSPHQEGKDFFLHCLRFIQCFNFTILFQIVMKLNLLVRNLVAQFGLLKLKFMLEAGEKVGALLYAAMCRMQLMLVKN